MSLERAVQDERVSLMCRQRVRTTWTRHIIDGRLSATARPFDVTRVILWTAVQVIA
jgi:hypothetical protein